MSLPLLSVRHAGRVARDDGLLCPRLGHCLQPFPPLRHAVLAGHPDAKRAHRLRVAVGVPPLLPRWRTVYVDTRGLASLDSLPRLRSRRGQRRTDAQTVYPHARSRAMACCCAYDFRQTWASGKCLPAQRIVLVDCLVAANIQHHT